ncbi:hypothetical protein CAEBREN_21284 [Caenorhabditis brenneri]|uniref:Uncharacterized protein n=1 Tax=Caenorhabditis brenneri TaxID=135651 RepID=G0NEZ6_CAEBE|nr:hypothetical protein CAEBREN_21284 [Caenorhabditis brenneri]
MKPENGAAPWHPAKRSCLGRLSTLETLLLVFICILITALLSVLLLWLWVLDGYRTFTDGRPIYPLPFENSSVAVDRSAKNHNDVVCTSRECVRLAGFLAENLNPKIDPCEDFYEFACGNYGLNKNLPANKPLRHTISDVQSRLNKQVKSMLQSPILPNEKSWDKLAKGYYQKCLDEEELETTGVEAMRDIAKRIGGWPTLEGDKWQEWPHSWEEQLALVLNLTGVNAVILEMAVTHDPSNSSRSVIELDQPKWGAGSRYPYLSGANDPMLRNYTTLMKLTAVALGADPAVADREMNEAMEFELKLVNFSADDMIRRDPERGNNRFELWQLKSVFPFINFEKYLKTVFKELVDLSPNHTVIVREIDYFIGIQHVLQSTPKRVLANYISWRLVQGGPTGDYFSTFRLDLTKKNTHAEKNDSFLFKFYSFLCLLRSLFLISQLLPLLLLLLQNVLREIVPAETYCSLSMLVWSIGKMINFLFSAGFSPFLPPTAREPFYQFKANQTGMFNSPPPDRWEDCVTLSVIMMDMPVGRLFVENFFEKERAMNKMTELTSYLKNEFIKQLHVLDWMDETTRRRAISKANMIEYKSGFPMVLFNDTWMEKNWGMIIKPREYLLHLTIRVKLVRFTEELLRLDQPLDRSMWFQSPAQVDAYYAPNNNEMIFPAGIMQFPFLTLGVPNYITYGMVGAVIGHEVSHAFDDQGGQYDELGNLNDWWDAETEEKFIEKTRCFVRQYENVHVVEADIHLNGQLSLGENIADNGGVKTAFNAYKAWKSNTTVSNEPALPGFQNFTSQQMFFLAYANNWCSLVRPKHYIQIILTDVHAPSKYRAMIPLQNRPEFAKAFQCPIGSPMNPERKCQVW